MFCRKCGRENADDAVYCQKCGVLLEPEEETRVARRDDGPDKLPSRRISAIDSSAESGLEDRIFSISPTLKFVKAGYILTALVALMLVAFFAIFLGSVSTWIAVILGLLLFLIPAYYHLKQRLIRYSLMDTAVEIDSGLLSRTTRNIPLRRIQDVTVAANVWQRMLGFGDVVIDNASEQGGKVALKNIDSPRRYADMLLKQMRLLDK